MTSGFALATRMDYIFFEIAAFIVFQQLFRMICRTGSYTINAEGGLNILQTTKHFTMRNSFLFC